MLVSKARLVVNARTSLDGSHSSIDFVGPPTFLFEAVAPEYRAAQRDAPERGERLDDGRSPSRFTPVRLTTGPRGERPVARCPNAYWL